VDEAQREVAPSHAAGCLRAGPAARSRLDARLRRTAVVAAVVAGVGLGFILLALVATDLLRDLLLSTGWRGGVAVAVNLLLSTDTPSQGAAVPVAPAPPLPGAQRDANDAPPCEKDSAFREWETLLTVLAVLAMVVHVFRTPAAIVFIARIVHTPRELADLVSSSLGGRTSSAIDTTRAWIILASSGLALCAVAWVLWGVLYLTAGARLRIAAITLAAVTLGLLVVLLSLYVFYMMRYSERLGDLFRGRGGESLINPLDSGSVAERVAVECLLPVVLLFILTRKPVKELFSLKLRRPRR
jgi:hypothetical protein